MKLFSAAVLATAVTANLQGEYSKLARGKKYNGCCPRIPDSTF